jgi:UDP-N-acetylglucosamine 2-epimerase (non-hydrolysing)
MKICIILGTRPEIIKMSPVIKECERRGLDYFVLHTGQHYSYDLDGMFFKELNLPDCKYNLEVGSGTHGEQLGRMLPAVEKVLREETPDVVLVQGDTNTVFAGALIASRLRMKIGHVEAGLRSFDRSMPEEANRVCTDHISDYLFAPTAEARSNLLREGVPAGSIFLVGNTIVDAVNQNLAISRSKADVLGRMGLKEKGFMLLTLHREENVDYRERLEGVLEGVRRVHERFGIPIVFPAHPRTVKRMKEYSIEPSKGMVVVEPLGYLEFMQLESAARVALTDSGGVQEEACILGTPCVTLRDNTERPETVSVGANALAGADPDAILSCVTKSMEPVRKWANPFGDGRAAAKILDVILSPGARA